MSKRSKEVHNITAQNIHINEKHPSSILEQSSKYSESYGFTVIPSRDVPARTDITGYVLTSYNKFGKAVWAESSGGGGSGSPAGTVQGALQLRNATGNNFEANDSLVWTSGTSTLSVPGKVSATTLETSGGITATGNEITSVTRVGGLVSPINPGDAASKAYVDGVAGQGISWKNPVVIASTVTNGNFSLINETNTRIIDGMSLSSFVNGERILLKHQTSSGENAVYNIVVPGTGGSGTVDFTLSSDFNGVKASGTAVFVETGTSQADQGFVVTDILGTDQFGSATSITWGQFTSSNASADGNSDEIQYNGGAGVFTASSDFKFVNGSQLLQVGNTTDNASIVLGTNRLSLNHDGTNGTVTNNLGTLTLGNSIRDIIISDVTLNQGNITASSVLFEEDGGSELVTLKAPTGVTANFDIILPNVAGGDKQMLYSDASQNLSWNYPNQNYKIVNVVAGTNTTGGEYSSGTPYNVQPGDRFIYVEESGAIPVSPVAINLPAVSSTAGMIITIGDKGGLNNFNTTLKIIEIHTDGSDQIQGYGIGQTSQFDLKDADYSGLTLISDGVSKWHLVA